MVALGQPSSSAPSSAPSPPVRKPFLPDALPATLPMVGAPVRCPTRCAWVPNLGAAPVPAKLSEHVLDAGATLAVERDDAITVIALVLEGVVVDAIDEPRPTKAATMIAPLSRLSGVSYRGGGFTLASEQGARVLLAEVQRRELESFTPRGKRWSVRPSGLGDPIQRFSLVLPPLTWAKGMFNAVIALEDVDGDRSPPRDPRARVIGPSQAGALATQRPDASFALLGIGGGASVPEHKHEGEWEHLVILHGSGKMSLGDAAAAVSSEVKPGAILHIPKGVPHSFQAAPGEDVIALQLYTPPGPEQRFKKNAAAH